MSDLALLRPADWKTLRSRVALVAGDEATDIVADIDRRFARAAETFALAVVVGAHALADEMHPDDPAAADAAADRIIERFTKEGQMAEKKATRAEKEKSIASKLERKGVSPKAAAKMAKHAAAKKK